MAQMVVADDNIAMAIQKTGEGIVAPDMFGNAVQQLNDAGIGSMVRQPLPGVDRAQAGAGWEVEVGNLRHGRGSFLYGWKRSAPKQAARRSSFVPVFSSIA